jgi:hypothetical protein
VRRCALQSLPGAPEFAFSICVLPMRGAERGDHHENTTRPGYDFRRGYWPKAWERAGLRANKGGHVAGGNGPAARTSSGAQASIPEKTAESVGERVGHAYSDPMGVAQYPKGNEGRLTATAAGSHNRDENNRFLSVGRGVIEERFLTVIAGFALGYLTAVLFHGRINAYFGTTPGPFQITKPPEGNRHPRGFVQSTVLKTPDPAWNTNNFGLL